MSDFYVRFRLEPKRVLHLGRCAIERRFERTLRCSYPPPIEDEKQIVARLQDPSEPTLEAEDSGLVVVLLEVLPGNVRRQVVVCAGGDHLRIEAPFTERNVISIAAQGD